MGGWMDRRMGLCELDEKVLAERDSRWIDKWADRLVVRSGLLLTHRASLCKF